MYIDSHAHIYSEEFNNDRNEVVRRALNAGVEKIVLPNIDLSSVGVMLELTDKYPDNCYPLIGLHPTSVDKNYTAELDEIGKWVGKRKFYGIGEVGIDLYWSKTFIKEQEDAFRVQVRMAKHLKLPIVIHVRNSFDEVYKIIGEEADKNLKGIFHCFTGNRDEAKKITDAGFKLGIGGVVTFKNSGLEDVLKFTDIGNLVLETDSPYLSPVPHRGKRNESSYIIHIAQKIADIYELPVKQVAEITSENVINLFGI